MFDITKIDSNFFLPFPKINQKLIGHDAAHHPSIHPSIDSCYHYHPTSILAVSSKSARSFRSIHSIIIPRQRSSIHCYYAPPFFTNSFFSSSSFPIRAKNLSHIFHQRRELSILLPSILLEYLDRQLLFVPLLCFSMSRATVMDAFTRVRGSNQSLPAAPPNTQEKPECL